MKLRPGKLSWLVLVVLALAGLVAALRPPAPDPRAVQAVAETRQLLRQQGFKTDLAEFDFSTSPELRAREAILSNIARFRFDGPFPDHPPLLQPIGNDAAIVVWKLDSLKKRNQSTWDESDQLTWEKFRAAIDTNRSLYDPACMAILSGPIRFTLNAQQGSRMLMPHLANMKNLAQAMGDRALLALHDGNQALAWTNALAATRLATAFEPGPMEISHLVRYFCAGLAGNTIWQALQTNGWTDDQLARLQQEWASVDYFSSLPETAAFTRACMMADCERERSGEADPKPTFSEFAKAAVGFPPSVLSELSYRWNQTRRRWNFDVEKEVMLYYRDREIELRNAIKAPTWAAMRQLPGVTNTVPGLAGHSRVESLMRLRAMSSGVHRQDFGLLGRSAQAEAQRRLTITALALERYRGKHGSYPNALAGLVPEFLETVPVDFMDGQPLRYRQDDNGHFLLYSVGLDGVDNGGKMRRSWRETGFDRPPRPGTPEAEFDLVWPRPNSDAAMQEEQQIQTEAGKTKTKVKELRQKEYLKEISDREWKQSLLRQSRVATILATNWSDPPEGPAFKGQSVQSLIGNVSVSDTNKLSLCALLTPKQIITGKEPEDITFEFPIRHDAITNNNILFVNVDGDPDEVVKFDSGGKVYDRERAANGDCLVIWHAIYDPPGRHAVQVYVVLEDKREGRLYFSGPPVAVTTSNLCQFSLDCVNYDVDVGARFHARLPEKNGNFSIECVTTNGAHLTTLTGSTTNGEFNVVWNLVDDHGHRLNGETFNSIVHISLPDSGRSQTLRGP